MSDFEDLFKFELGVGAHKHPSLGLCAMEAVAWLEGLEHTDDPPCTSPTIASYVRAINDSLPYEYRQSLVSYLPWLVGTNVLEYELERREVLLLGIIGSYLPLLIRFVGHGHLTYDLEHVSDKSRRELVAVLDRVARNLKVAPNRHFCLPGVTLRVHRIGSMTQSLIYHVKELETEVNPWARAPLPTSTVNMSFEIGLASPGMALGLLDELLAVGPRSQGFSQDVPQKVIEYERVLESAKT